MGATGAMTLIPPGSENERQPSTEATVPEANEPARHLGRGKKALFALAILVVLLLATELGLRCVPATRLGFVYQNSEFSTPVEFTNDTTRNAKGFHDVEHGPTPPNVRRVVLLGDSYVAGWSVAVHETVGQRLEHYLNAAGDSIYEVISIGRRGWGQREQLQAFKLHESQNPPDWVVTLFLSLNDVRDNSEALDADADAQLREMDRGRPGRFIIRARDVPLFLVRASKLNQLLSHRLSLWCDTSGVAGIPIDYYVYATVQDDRWQQAWRTTEQLLVRTHELATSVGARYAVVCASTPHGVLEPGEAVRRLVKTYPDMGDHQWNVDKPDRRVDQMCKARGIPTLLLQPLFRNETVKNGRRLHWKFDGHWNREGNDFAAQEIARFILELDRPAKRLENE